MRPLRSYERSDRRISSLGQPVAEHGRFGRPALLLLFHEALAQFEFQHFAGRVARQSLDRFEARRQLVTREALARPTPAGVCGHILEDNCSPQTRAPGECLGDEESIQASATKLATFELAACLKKPVQFGHRPLRAATRTMFEEVFIGQLGRHKSLDWGGDREVGNVPRPMSPIFPTRGARVSPHALVIDWMACGRLQGRRVDWGAYAARGTVLDLLEFLTTCYGQNGIPEDIGKFVLSLPPHQQFALVAANLEESDYELPSVNSSSRTRNDTVRRFLTLVVSVWPFQMSDGSKKRQSLRHTINNRIAVPADDGRSPEARDGDANADRDLEFNSAIGRLRRCQTAVAQIVIDLRTDATQAIPLRNALAELEICQKKVEALQLARLRPRPRNADDDNVENFPRTPR